MLAKIKKQLLFSLFALAFFLIGCSSASSHRGEYLTPFHAGDILYAETEISRITSKEMPNSDYRESKDATWLLLDKGMMNFASGNSEVAFANFHQAIEALDFYQKECSSEQVGKVILQDELGAYIPEDFEQVLARVYFALVLLHQGDQANAFAMLRQAEEWQQKQREIYHRSVITQDYQLIDNALSKYLFALLLEKRNDLSNATLLYQQASQLACQDASCEEINNLTRLCSDSKAASVVVLCHNGNAPYKVSGITDVSVASTIALELFLDSFHHDFALSSLGGIPTPALQYWDSIPLPSFVSIDNVQKRLTPWFDIGTTAEEQLSQKLPVIVARGAARYLMRRGAVAYASEHDASLGGVVDLGMLLVNLNTKADTRSWNTLPEFIDIARFDVNPGSHNIAIQIQDPCRGLKTYSYSLKLSSQDLCIIHVFNIHPGVTMIQVPKRFIDPKQGDLHEKSI